MINTVDIPNFKPGDCNESVKREIFAIYDSYLETKHESKKFRQHKIKRSFMQLFILRSKVLIRKYKAS